MNSIVPAVFANGTGFAIWPSDLGLSVTSQFLDSLMKSLPAKEKCSVVDMCQIRRCPFPETLPVP